MNKHYFHLLIILGLSWSLYAQCQEDILLPGIAFALVLLSYFWRLNAPKSFGFMTHLSVVRVIIISAVAGIFWRTLMPAPAMASAVYLEIISAAQAASIIAAALLWFKPYSKENIIWLSAFSWATVALSINVPFTEVSLLLFRLFCILSVVNILIHTFPKPEQKKRQALHCRQLLIFGLILVVVTGFFFKNITRGIRIFDRVFMSLVGDYLIPRGYTHFLSLSPLLRLGNPGYSAIDRRPVLEVDSHGYTSIYLKTQVFETYEDGVWQEIGRDNLLPVPSTLNPEHLKVDMLMFRSFEKIIPSPYGLQAVTGTGAFSRDADYIVYANERRRTRFLSFTLGGWPEVSAGHAGQTRRRLLHVPRSLREPLKALVQKIVPDQSDPERVAETLQDHFKDNYQYTLNVDFRADEEGLLKMIQEKKPAYCTYFATALAMMLRSAGIPSRVVTGFASGEKIGAKGKKILVRVRHAHAWAEALLPVEDAKTGTTHLTWLPYDGTPTGAGEVIRQSSSRFNYLADQLWLFLLRSSAHIQNIDKEQLKRTALWALIAVLLLINAKKIFARLWRIDLFARFGSSKTVRSAKEIEALYQRYEHFLRKHFRERRFSQETDADLLRRLSERGDIPERSMENIRAFIRHYRAVRFGGRENGTLHEILKKLS